MAAFTSSDEFNLERRVWMTNETPPYDLYKALHSGEQTAFWKWFLGTSTIDYNLPYKVYSEQNGTYIHAADTDEVYLKMTNGQVSKNYGPTVSGNPNDENFNPLYTRMEIDGVVLPEFDLMLHEVYRYLETLYPDHPDERYLLTDNEFNDTILAAADMINYAPDVKFFDKVAETLSNSLSASDIEDESAKIKIRNLINNSFRRKLYGSKAGYRMFANDIFQICTIFPVATYLPLNHVNPALLTKEQNTLNNLSALNALNMTKQEYKNYTRQNNRSIDTYSELYYRKFRLVDWDGQNSSYLQKSDENTYFHGISIPCNENRIYEYPNIDDARAEVDGISVGSTIENVFDDKGITYVNDVSNGIFEIKLKKEYKYDTGEVYALETVSPTNEIHYVTTSHLNAIPYRTGYIYNYVYDLFDVIANNTNSEEDKATLFNSISSKYVNHFINNVPSSSTQNFLESIYSSIKSTAYEQVILPKLKPSTINVILNPYVANTILLKPSDSIKHYPNEEPDFDLVFDEEGNDTGYINTEPDTMIDGLNLFDKYIGDTDLTDTEEKNINYLYYISNFTKGSIEVTFPDTAEKIPEMPALYDDGRYAFVINTSRNKKVVMFGRLDMEYIEEVGQYRPYYAKLKITSIPEKKSLKMVEAVYPDYRSIVDARAILANKFETYKKAFMTIKGCEDLAYLFSLDEDIRTYSDTDSIPTSKVGLVDTTYYFKTYSDEIIELGSSPYISTEEALALYNNKYNVIYDNFIKDYLEDKAYEAVIDSYRENRSYIAELGSYTDDMATNEEDWATFEMSTIYPSCRIEKILELNSSTFGNYDGSPDEGKRRAYTDMGFSSGTISEISLGNLNIIPVLDNSSESFNIYDYTIGNGSISTSNIESNQGEYKWSSTNSIIYPELPYFKKPGEDKNKIGHPTIKVQLSLGSDYRVDYNAQAYSEINLNVGSEVTARDWFANYSPESVNAKNITVKPTKTTTVQIESVIDAETENMSNIITFESDVAREAYKTLSIGDTIFGPTINSDDENLYITSIGYNTVTVNRPFTQSGKFIFTYNCKLNIIGEDQENDMSAYKALLDSNGLYSLTNPFEHGLWGSSSFPYASNATLESMPDISFYKPYNYTANEGDIERRIIRSFDEVVNKIHPLRYEGDTYVRMPSTIKFMNDLFVELNIKKVIPTKSRSGVDGVLMSVDWLDYVSNSLMDISRATDKANVGVNLMMETDTSGYYTLNENLTYTDPNVQLKFITMNSKGIKPMWNNVLVNDPSDWTVPAYAQIGTGGEGRFAWFTSPADVTYPNIWGNNVYDSPDITTEDITALNANNGAIKKRSTWGTDDYNDEEDTESDSKFRSVERPLFEIPLGEYDVQTRYLPTGVTNVNRACTTIQSSFYAQTFNNLTKYMPVSTLDIDNENEPLSMPIVVNNTSLINNDPIKTFGTNNIKYKGEWVPSTRESTEDKSLVINEPTFNNAYEYYIIPTETVLSNVNINGQLKNKKYLDHSIYMCTQKDSTEKYRLFVPEFAGYIYYDSEDSHNVDNVPSLIEALILKTLVGLKLNNQNTEVEYKKQINNAIRLGNLDTNKIYWFGIGTMNAGRPDYFADISAGDIIGLVLPETMPEVGSDDISGFSYMVFNRGYYTSTLKIDRPAGIDLTDEQYARAIGVSSNSGTYSVNYELNDGVTEIKLPRKCITEGSYNFDYIIDARVNCTGYLYGSSTSNEIAYQAEDGDTTDYDKIENDNFDIIIKDEVTFNGTRSAFYKDDENDVFYTYTDIVNGVQYPANELKKVAIKFEEQKYFKNTTTLTGVYKKVLQQSSGSANIDEIPTLREITGINDFNTALVSNGDRILRITPIELRSVYSEYLEPVLYSKYYDVDAMVRGFDNNGNLVLSYDNTILDPVEKFNFGVELKTLEPVTKLFDDDTQSFRVEHSNETLFRFTGDNAYLAPSVNSVKFTKSIVSDDKAASSNDYEFKYFKNLLLLKASVAKAGPNMITPASTDSGQFRSALEYVQIGDSAVAGLKLTTGDDMSFSDIIVSFNDVDIKTIGDTTIEKAYYAPATKAFICSTSSGKVGLAFNVDLVTSHEVKLSYYADPSHKAGENYISFQEGYKITNIAYSEDGWLVTIKETTVTKPYFISFNYSDANDRIAFTEAFASYSFYTKPADATVIALPDPHQVINSEGNLEIETNSYARIDDLSIREVTQEGITIEPYAITYSNPIQTDGFYFADTKSEWAVYASGRELFVKSPIYYTDENGNYLDDLSEKFYWKYARVPLLNETGLFTYQNYIDSQSEVGAWTAANTLRAGILSSYAGIEKCNDFIKKVGNDYYFITELKADGTVKSGGIANVIPNDGNTLEQKEFIAAIDKVFGGVSVDARPSLKDIVEVYGKYAQILQNMMVMPWYSSDPTSVTISKLIETALSRKTKQYYYLSNGKFIINTELGITPVNGVYYQEYLEAAYNDSDRKVHITYHGIGPYVKATLSTPSLEYELDNIYGSDFRFNTTYEWVSTDKADSNWYAEYLNNFATYGLLQDENEEVTAGNITNVIFGKDTLVFIANSGRAICIEKSKLYKASDFRNSNNWKVSSVPEGLSFYYSDTKSQVIKTLKYGDNATDEIELATKAAYLNVPIYDIETVHATDDVIIMAGKIWSREKVEDAWHAKYFNDLDNEAGQLELSKCVRNTKFWYTDYPIILYSTNGGRKFDMAVIPEELPGYMVRSDDSAFEYNDASRIPGYGIKLSDQLATVKIYKKAGDKDALTPIKTNLKKTFCGNADMYIYDNISTNNILHSSQHTGVKISSIIEEPGTRFQFYLECTDGTSTYDYILEVNKNDINEYDFIDTTYVDIKEDTKAKAYEYIVKYPTFSLIVSPINNRIGISSQMALNLGKVIEVSESGIKFAVDLFEANTSGGIADVLIAFETSRAVSITAQKSCIDTSLLNDYFEDGVCLLPYVKEVPTRANADGMYNYRETIDPSIDSFGYRSIAEDMNATVNAHKFYKYDETTDANDETIYTPVDYKNADDNEIYLCTSTGNYINKSDNVVTELSFHDIVKSSIFSTNILSKAAQPAYDSVEDACKDKDLRNEDDTLKDAVTLSKIISINSENTESPYADKLINEARLDALEPNDYITKIEGKYYISRSNPSNIVIGSDIETLDINSLLDIGNYYRLYTGAELKIDSASNCYVFKKNNSISVSNEIPQDCTLAGIRESLNFNNIMAMPNNSYFRYIGTSALELLTSGEYIVYSNNTFTTSAAKPIGNFIEAPAIDSLSMSSFENLTVDNYQRKITGSDFTLAKNSYIIKQNDKLSIFANYSVPGSDTDSVMDALSAPLNSYKRYTGSDTRIQSGSYIAKQNGKFSILTEELTRKAADIKEFNLQAFMDVTDHTYSQYTGSTVTINNGNYLMNINGVHSTSINNPTVVTNSEITLVSHDIDTIISAVKDLPNLNYIEMGEDVDTALVSQNDIVLNNSGVLTKFSNAILGLTKVSNPDNIGLNTTFMDSIDNDSYYEYNIDEPTQIVKNNFILNDDSNIVQLSISDLTERSGTTLNAAVNLEDKEYIRNNTDNDVVLAVRNKIISKKTGVVSIADDHVYFLGELGGKTINDIMGMSKNTCFRNPTELSVIPKSKFVIRNSTGYKVVDALPASMVKPTYLTSFSFDKLLDLEVNATYVNIGEAVKVPVINTGDLITVSDTGSISRISPQDHTYQGPDASTEASDTLFDISSDHKLRKLDITLLYATEHDATYVYNGPSIVLNLGDTITINVDHTITQTSDFALSTFDLNKIKSTPKNSFLIALYDFNLASQSYVINDGGTYSITATHSLYDLTPADDLNTFEDILNMEDGTYSYWNSDNITVPAHTDAIRFNNKLFTSLGDLDDFSNILSITENNYKIYTGESLDIFKHNYIIRKDDKISIAKNKIYGFEATDDIISIDDIIALPENTYASFTADTITLAPLNCFLKRQGKVELLSEIADAALDKAADISNINLNYPMANNTYAKYTGTAYNIMGGSYIIRENNILNITTIAPLISNGVMEEFNTNDLFSFADGTFKQYTGPDYLIAQNSYFVNNGTSLVLSSNWPLKDCGTISALDTTTLDTISSTAGNFYYKVNSPITLGQNTYFAKDEASAFYDVTNTSNILEVESTLDTFNINTLIHPIDWYIGYVGGDFIIEPNTVLTYDESNQWTMTVTESIAPGITNVTSKNSLFGGILNMAPGTSIAYTGNRIIFEKNTYIVPSSDNIITVSKPGYSKACDINATSNNLVEIATVLRSSHAPNYFRKYIGEEATIINTGNYIVRDPDGSFRIMVGLNITEENTLDDTYTALDDSSENPFGITTYGMEPSSYYKYVGTGITINKGTVFRFDYDSSIDGFVCAITTDTIVTQVKSICTPDANLINDIFKLTASTCIKYTGPEYTIPNNMYLIKFEDEFRLSDSIPTEVDSFETLDLRDLIGMSNNTYKRYTGDRVVIKTNSYLLKQDNAYSIRPKGIFTSINELNLKEISAMEDDKYFQYTGKPHSLSEMGLTVEVSDFDTEILDTYLYIEGVDRTQLERDTEALDRNSLTSKDIFVGFDDRYTLKSFKDSATKYYFDNRLNYFPIKPVRYISLMARVGYNVDRASIFYTKQNLDDIPLDSTSMPNAITSIYLPQRGYGGTRLRTEANNSWTVDLPWELDPEAFGDKHLLNKYNEPVTVCDSLGAEIMSNNGEFPVSNNDEITITAADIPAGGSKTVSLSIFNDEVKSEQFTATIYKPVHATSEIWSSQDTVFINFDGNVGSIRDLANIYVSTPCMFSFEAVTSNNAVIKTSTNNIDFVNDTNFAISNGVLSYTVPAEITVEPSYIQITVGDLVKVFTVVASRKANAVYSNSEIRAGYYNIIDNKYNIIKTFQLGDIAIADYNAGQILDSTPNTIWSTATETVNLPIFNIGITKTFFMYDGSYTGGSIDAHLRHASYINDIDVTDKITCALNEATKTIECTYTDTSNSLTFTFQKERVDITSLAPVGTAYLTISSGSSFVVINDDDVCTLKVVDTSDSDNLYVTGARGPIYMRVPNYPTFKDLIANKQYIIDSYEDYFNASTVKNGTDSVTDHTFSLIETNGVTFNKELPVSGLNDGESHFIRLEVLTQKTVDTTDLNIFGDDYEEISISDMEIFPPDRVYFNPNGYPSSPVTINNRVYNSENNVYYTGSLFTNNNGAYLRECDATGKFVKYTIKNGEAVRSTISRINNDSINNIYIPYRPNYMSCKDWFENEFYVKGYESNPFWQVINLTSKFDSVTQIWNQELSLNKYEKVGKIIKQVATSDDEAYVILNKASACEIIDGDIQQTYNCDYLDLFEGKIRFILTEPTSTTYGTNGPENIIKFGICAKNNIVDTFHPEVGEPLKVPGYLQSTYTVNSHKNMANPNDEDSAIVEVTELGIFNKAHVLIAYAVFPPIEYRSDTQHISFTSFVKYGTCSIENVE